MESARDGTNVTPAVDGFPLGFLEGSPKELPAASIEPKRWEPHRGCKPMAAFSIKNQFSF
jgi:hypothetical protein